MDLKQTLKNIKNTESGKVKKIKESIEKNKIEKKEKVIILNEIKNKNALLNKETKKKISGKRELHYF